MEKIVKSWKIPKYINDISFISVIIEDGYIKLQLSGYGFTSILSSQKVCESLEAENIV